METKPDEIQARVYRYSNEQLKAVKQELDLIVGSLACEACLAILQPQREIISKEASFRLGD